MTSGLKQPSSSQWLDAVMTDFDTFLLDHAANERKASSMALAMVSHYPDRLELLEAMIDLALEELNHFRQVMRLIIQRGLKIPPDEKDAYVNQLRRHIRRGPEEYLLDRLLTAAVIEARGAERFSLIAARLEQDETGTFYRTLAQSETNHHELFLTMATLYFAPEVVEERYEWWLQIEAEVLDGLPVRPRLH